MGSGASKHSASGSGASKSSVADHSPITPPLSPPVPAVPESPRQPTSAIDARIIQTLHELNLTRRQSPTKVKPMNFERIVLRFGMARDAFETIHCIYYQFANDDGLNFEALKAALNAIGAQMNESDMRDIFYESDMVRDNSLSHNEFIVSLAISFLLGLITNFDSITLIAPEEQPCVGPHADGSARSHRESVSGLSARGDAPAIIAKTLELVVTAYLLFDDDASGTIQTNEVRNIMQKHESSNRRKLERVSSGFTTKAIRNERIKEMDVNEDGTITFQEFVLTFQKWVGIDDS